jgi:hypothetical protein
MSRWFAGAKETMRDRRANRENSYSPKRAIIGAG